MPLLLCDLDDTLIDRAGAFRRWATAFVDSHGVPAEQLPWILAVDNDGHTGRRWFLAALRERLQLTDSVDDLLAEYDVTYPEHIQPPPGETLAALRRLRASGWRIGIVTNGATVQEVKMAKAELIPLLDGWCVSDLVGHRKPDPAIFRLAAERCGANLDGAWMIGDTGAADIAGASALGIRSVWLRHGREWRIAGYRPSYVADSFAAAVDLVERVG